MSTIDHIVLADMADANTTDYMTDLLDEKFDAVEFLNDSLPSLNLSSQTTVKQSRPLQLQSASTELQSELTKLNTLNARTSTELTTLTDEILRSGNRLAYEVEVLRSDANSLYDLLSETLREDIQLFVKNEQITEADSALSSHDQTNVRSSSGDPEFMQQLRLLGHVKVRLEQVIKVFGDALKWPIPPSDVSMASSLISVSAPELGVQSTAEDDKARHIIRQYREEISDLLNSEGGGHNGLEAAQRRLATFQNLALIWKSTAEEKARNRVVDGFSKIVDDRRKVLDSQGQSRRGPYDSGRNSAQPSRTSTPSVPSGGLFGGLRKLRDEIYLE